MTHVELRNEDDLQAVVVTFSDGTKTTLHCLTTTHGLNAVEVVATTGPVVVQVPIRTPTAKDDPWRFTVGPTKPDPWAHLDLPEWQPITTTTTTT